MLTTRIQPTPQEVAYYETLFAIAGPDLTGYIPGKAAAEFLSTSGLVRDVLHKIWSLADVNQEGKLNKESFFVACRLVAHVQSGLPIDPSLVTREPGVLPMFEGLKRPSASGGNLRPDDVISVSDLGGDSGQAYLDPTRASNIAMSLSRLGMDPLEFIPFQSGPDASLGSKPTDWALPEAQRQKYASLFAKLDKDALGRVNGKTARGVLERSGLSKHVLGLIWELADLDADGHLTEQEFVLAMHLTSQRKKGHPLPAELPKILAESTASQGAAPTLSARHATSTVRVQSEPSSWKYSRTYLDSAVEDERRLRTSIEGDVDETEEDMRHTFDLCSQVEGDISRMAIELDKRRALLRELDRTKQELLERRARVTEMRKHANLDKISLGRDRTKLQSEIIHLRKLLNDNTKDAEILRNGLNETEHELNRILTQTRSLETQRKEAGKQHNEEMIRIESEQRETAALMDSWQQLGREEEIRVESNRIMDMKKRIISDMQRSPTDDGRITATSAFTDKSNRWATTMLGASSKGEKGANIGFGTSFFSGSPSK